MYILYDRRFRRKPIRTKKRVPLFPPILIPILTLSPIDQISGPRRKVSDTCNPLRKKEGLGVKVVDSFLPNLI